jgi:hypothetical protein
MSEKREGSEGMKTTIRAYLPAGGACARRTALRLFLMYGIRPRLISRQISTVDRLYPFWRLTPLPAALPDDLFAEALLEAARAEQDDRLAVLYWCDDTLLPHHRAVLESAFVLRRADGSAYSPHVKEVFPI